MPLWLGLAKTERGPARRVMQWAAHLALGERSVRRHALPQGLVQAVAVLACGRRRGSTEYLGSTAKYSIRG